ncbi:MAG: HAMP domain-containing protein, partial [Xanthobacteraceae bacterium]|nr:HAMP domain-containing protein [Xanthobacteraceae bacterium]
MTKISNVKILYKILACFVLLGLVVGGAIWFATAKMKAIDDTYSAILEHEVRALKAGIRANIRVFNFGRLSWRLIAENEIADMNKTIEEIGANHKEFLVQIDLAKKDAPNLAARFEQARQTFEAILRDHVAIEKAALANNNEEALRLAKAMMARTAELRNSLVDTNEALDKAMQAKSDQASAETNQTIFITIASITIALALVFLLAFGLVQFGIAKPLAGLVGALKKLAGGDFDVALPGLGRKDEVGDIAGSVEAFKVKLEEKMRLDAEKEQEIARREQAERDERARQEAENARMVADVVAALGAGLDNLSRGNLTYRVTDEFAGEYKK